MSTVIRAADERCPTSRASLPIIALSILTALSACGASQSPADMPTGDDSADRVIGDAPLRPVARLISVTVLEGNVEENQARSVIGPLRPRIDACLASVTVAAGGRVELRARVDTEGVVRDGRAEHDDGLHPDLVGCLLTALAAAHFPALDEPIELALSMAIHDPRPDARVIDEFQTRGRVGVDALAEAAEAADAARAAGHDRPMRMERAERTPPGPVDGDTPQPTGPAQPDPEPDPPTLTPAVARFVEELGLPPPTGQLPPEQVEATLATRRQAMQACWEFALSREPGLSGGGRVVYHLVVDPEGLVDTLLVREREIESADLDDCVFAQLRSLRFQPPTPSGFVHLSYPMQFGTAQ